jgi:hypothetical protein
MADSSSIPFGPLSPIIAAIISALIGAAVTYFIIHKKSKVSFYVEKSDNITSALTKLGKPITFNCDDKIMHQLSTGGVVVRNIGNVSIANFCFDILFKCGHSAIFVDAVSENKKLVENVIVERTNPGADMPSFSVKMPYLNAAEFFKLRLLFDGDNGDIDICFRMENVTSRIVKQNSVVENALDTTEAISSMFSFPGIIMAGIGVLRRELLGK